MTVVSAPAEKTYPVPSRLLGKDVPTPFVNSIEQYKTMWQESVDHPNTFFGNVSSPSLCLVHTLKSLIDGS